MSKNNTVVMTKKEYDELMDARERLSALECAGVDNWEGYGYAMKIYRGEEE